MARGESPITNRNFLSPAGFNFILGKAREVDFFCQSANIPMITMGNATQATNLRNIPVPGDELYYGDLVIKFLIDEDMTNYIALHTWMRKLGFPVDREEVDFETYDQAYRKGIKFGPDAVQNNRVTIANSIDYNFDVSDATLQILNSNYRVARNIKFYDCFPVSLSTLDFQSDVSDIQYLTASASFKYLYFDIV